MDNPKKPNKQYTHFSNGDIMTVAPGNYFHLACCDCGLDHLLVTDLTKDGDIQLIIYRDERRTKIFRAKAGGLRIVKRGGKK